MAFDRNNLAGIAEHSPHHNNSSENKVTRVELDAHTSNKGIHVSIQDRHYWNSIEQRLRDYVDYRLKTIIGKFDFGEIGIDNSLTLSQIILLSNKERIADIQAERGERNALIEAEREERNRSIESEVRARTSAVALIDEQLLDINNRITKETRDRIQADEAEATTRSEQDAILSNRIDDTNSDLDKYYRELIAKIELEAVTRANEDLEVESRLNNSIGNQNQQIADINNTVQSFITLHNNDSIIMKQTTDRLETAINQEVQDRIAAVNQEATTRLAADNDIYARLS